MTFDIAIFFNDYQDLRSITPASIPICQPLGLPVSNPACFANFAYSELPLQFINGGKQDTKGLELAISYVALDWWRMHLAYSYLKLDGDDFSNAPDSAGEDSPEHQLSLRSNMNIGKNIDLDVWMRYIDELKIQMVDSYVTLDARLAWRVTDAIRVSLIGRNLLESDHLEFQEEFGSNQAVEIPREALAELTWQF
jgi:iron complex outermembrane receptor protein